MKKVNWLIVGVISAVVILLLFGGGMMMGGWRYPGWGMMGSGGVMGDWGISPFGWAGTLFMWLIPASLIALVVFGIVWLVRNASNPKPPSS